MSTKATILLTNDSEHWYEELNAPYNLGIKEERAVVLEFEAKHMITKFSDGSFGVIVKEGTALYGCIMQKDF